MKTRYVIAALAVAAILVSSSLNAGDTDKKDPLKGITCVINTKKSVKADNFVAYKKGKVYFCCQGCPKAFKKDTAKHATKANAQLVATGQYKQAKCPISGKSFNAKHTVKVAGVKVQFCCPNCKGKVAKSKGADQLALVYNNKGFDKNFVKVEKKKK